MTAAKIPLPANGTKVRITVHRRRGSYGWERLPDRDADLGLLGVVAEVVGVAPCGRRVRVRLPARPVQDDYGVRQIVAFDVDEYEILPDEVTP